MIWRRGRSDVSHRFAQSLRNQMLRFTFRTVNSCCWTFSAGPCWQLASLRAIHALSHMPGFLAGAVRLGLKRLPRQKLVCAGPRVRTSALQTVQDWSHMANAFSERIIIERMVRNRVVPIGKCDTDFSVQELRNPIPCNPIEQTKCRG